MTPSTVIIDSLQSVSEMQPKRNIKDTDIYLHSAIAPESNYSINFAYLEKITQFPSSKIEEIDDSFLKSTEKRKPITLPDFPILEGLDNHNAALTDRIRILLNKFWAIVISQALQSIFPINKASVEIFRDPNEDRKKISIKVFTEATASQSVAFWEGLEDDIQDWLKTLDNHSKILFLRDISLRIHWK